jgi:hypothetical protein
MVDFDELMKREIIRNDYAEEMLNKMTDSEIKDHFRESNEFVNREYPDLGYPHINVQRMCYTIDMNLLYLLHINKKGYGKK